MTHPTPEQLADHGHHGVQAVAQHAARDSRLVLRDLTSREIIVRALHAIAHLCDRAGVDFEQAAASANALYDQTLRHQPKTAALHLPGTGDAPWSHVPPPLARQTPNGPTVLSWLLQAAETAGGITSSEMRARGISNPSNIVKNLQKQGHHITAHPQPKAGSNGRETLYLLHPATDAHTAV